MISSLQFSYFDRAVCSLASFFLGTSIKQQRTCGSTMATVFEANVSFRHSILPAERILFARVFLEYVDVMLKMRRSGWRTKVQKRRLVFVPSDLPFVEFPRENKRTRQFHSLYLVQANECSRKKRTIQWVLNRYHYLNPWDDSGIML